MKPKWQKLASLAQEICTLQFQFFGAVFASKGHPFKNILILNGVSMFLLFHIIINLIKIKIQKIKKDYFSKTKLLG